MTSVVFSLDCGEGNALIKSRLCSCVHRRDKQITRDDTQGMKAGSKKKEEEEEEEMEETKTVSVA